MEYGGNVRNVHFDDITFTRLPSRNRCLKGECVIDISPAKEMVPVPEGFTGFSFVQGAEREMAARVQSQAAGICFCTGI